MKEPYGSYCAGMLYDLIRKYPKSFWASPNDFFTGTFKRDYEILILHRWIIIEYWSRFWFDAIII